jgi:hypothetical protein
MWHSCVRLSEAEFFADRPAQRRLYRAFLKLARSFGPVTVNVNKSRISFQARVRFAGIVRIVKDGIVCGFWLKRRIDSPRFLRVELIPPRDWVYQFKLRDAAELDDEVRSWIEEAYQVGMQAAF